MPKDRTILVKAKVCDETHGGPGNAATVYGHFGSTKTCVRIGMSNVWVFDLTRTGRGL